MFVDLSVAALVNQLADGLEIRLAGEHSAVVHAKDFEDRPIGDIWLDKTEHLLGGLRNLHKNTIVDLQQTEEL